MDSVGRSALENRRCIDTLDLPFYMLYLKRDLARIKSDSDRSSRSRLVLKVHLTTYTTPLTVLPVNIYSFRPSLSLNPSQHHHMAAQPGPGTEPVHTLYDEQGAKALATPVR